MDIKLEKKLVKKFPILYQYAKKPSEPLIPMIFGFECENGWYELIYQLSNVIEKFNHMEKDDPIVAFQVKEKFGGLRFYINGAPQEIHDLINEAEHKSFEICEGCGKPGSMHTLSGWYLKTLCDECFQKRSKK